MWASLTPHCSLVFSVQSCVYCVKLMPGYFVVFGCSYQWLLNFPNYLLLGNRNTFDCYILILYRVTFLNSLVYFTRFFSRFCGVLYTVMSSALTDRVTSYFPVSMPLLSSGLEHRQGQISGTFCTGGGSRHQALLSVHRKHCISHHWVQWSLLGFYWCPLPHSVFLNFWFVYY